MEFKKFMAPLNRLSRPEIYRLVYDYIEVHGGYLGDFSYRTHEEFYPHYCDLDIDPNDYEGTTRDRFFEIITNADGLTQATIISGILRKYPVSSFSEDSRDQKQILFDEFQSVIERLKSLNQRDFGVRGEIKNLIFAANGPKPKIVLTDATLNTLKIVENSECCLVYDRGLEKHGLKWGELVDWWRDINNLSNSSRTEQRQSLYLRLKLSLAENEYEKLVLSTYYKGFFEEWNDSLPALIPQVYLHYDPYTIAQLGGAAQLPRQRMDFLLLLPDRHHIVLEIDGKQHYADGEIASPKLYSEMVQEDRRLKLAGYEVYRFGGYELWFDKDQAERMLVDFFESLFLRYELAPENQDIT